MRASLDFHKVIERVGREELYFDLSEDEKLARILRCHYSLVSVSAGFLMEGLIKQVPS